MMLWLLAEDTTDISALLKLGGAMGGAAALTLLLAKLYELYRKYKDGKKQDDKDAFDLNLKKGEAHLALNIKEEEQIEAQLQRVINQQDALITRLQTRRDERVVTLEKRIDGLQISFNECLEKHAAESTRSDFLQRQLDEVKAYSTGLKGELDNVKRKYYSLKHGQKPDSDVIPPETEIVPEK